MVDVILRSSPRAAAAQPLIEGLVAESARRYGTDRPGGARAEVERYPAEAFVPPVGDFLLLLRDGATIGGGGFMSHDDDTAELKRIWTLPSQRRQGLARCVVSALEERAAALGYTRAYLTTGARQPEAVALYLALGYRPLFDLSADPALFRSLPFEKRIGARSGEPGTSPLRRAAASAEAASAEVAAIKDAQEAKILARLGRLSAAA